MVSVILDASPYLKRLEALNTPDAIQNKTTSKLDMSKVMSKFSMPVYCVF